MLLKFLNISEMAQASLRLGRSLTNQAIRRQFSCGVALSGKHVSYSVQDGVAVLRYVMKLIRDWIRGSPFLAFLANVFLSIPFIRYY